MSWTKGDFVRQAFEEIGFASYIYDLQPEQLQSALRRQDAMVATWNAIGIRIGYPLPGSPDDSNLDTATSVPDSANEAIFLNLAIRIAPSVGKTVSQETKQAAKIAYDALLVKVSLPPEMQLPGSMPAGGGNRPQRGTQSPFLNPPTDPLLAGEDSAIDFE